VELQPNNPRGYFLRSAIYFWMFSEDVGLLINFNVDKLKDGIRRVIL